MRLVVLTVGVLGIATTASAQLRFETAAVTRSENARFDDDVKGRVTAIGGAVGVLFAKHYGIEGELTTATGHVTRSYEGNVISYAERDATRDEIERMAVRARRSMTKTPGIGGSVAFRARATAAPRVDIVLRAGAMFRRYAETETATVLRVPEGIQFERAASAFRDTRITRTRGGLLIGIGLPIQVLTRLMLEPEFRVVWGGPTKFDVRYRDTAIGARAVVMF
jgi:hypothetical protein